MKPYLSFSKMKGIAKEQLLGKFGAVIFAMLLYLALRNSSMLLTPLSSGDSIVSMIVLYILTLGLDVLFGMFQFGISKLFLNIATSRQFSVFDIFSAFKGATDRILVISGFVAIISFICHIPFYVFSFCIQFNLISIKYSLIKMYVVLLVCEVLFFLISLNFSQIYYMAVDLPDVPATKLIKMSTWLIRGNRLRFLCLQLSFIPLQLIGFLSLGIGFLWINPYIDTTYANFYLDLSEKKTPM